MQEVKDGEGLLAIEDNVFIGTPPEIDAKSLVRFKGTGNVLFCEEGVSLKASKINFNGSNGLIALGRNKHPYNANLTTYTNCSIVMGRDIYFNGLFHAIASEERFIAIGDGCLMSFGIWVRTADPHLVYSLETHERINPSRDVLIGDHVWIGQNATILKGTSIGSGSIVGAGAVVAGKSIESNESWAGNPARRVASGIFWTDSSVHNWTEKQTKKNNTCSPEGFAYAPDGHTLTSQDLSEVLRRCKTAEERLEYWQSISYDNTAHNRFAAAVPVDDAAQETPDKKGRLGLFGR